jgi:rubrerythrin
MISEMGEALIGGTAWQQALYAHLNGHAEAERELLDTYRQAAEESESAAFRYLVSMILDDEVRHHRTFSELAATLKIEVGQLREEFPIPPLGHWGFEHRRITELTEALLEQERRDSTELEQLSIDLEEVEDIRMWGLLVEMMRADTAKHVRILEFIRDHAGVEN